MGLKQNCFYVVKWPRVTIKLREGKEHKFAVKFNSNSAMKLLKNAH